jgi:antitoxin component of RelBE/YafQ-DinJ toxin-antitoxin module
VPNQPKTPNRAVRVDDQVWDEAGQAAAEMGTDRTKVINQFLRWYLRRSGAKLPARPPVQESGE